MAMEEEIRPTDSRGRNVDQEKALAAALEEQPRREAETPVVIAQNTVERPAQGLDRVKSFLIAIVAEVPDHVSPLQFTSCGGREPIVRVGNYCNEHGQVLSFRV